MCVKTDFLLTRLACQFFSLFLITNNLTPAGILCLITSRRTSALDKCQNIKKVVIYEVTRAQFPLTEALRVYYGSDKTHERSSTFSSSEPSFGQVPLQERKGDPATHDLIGYICGLSLSLVQRWFLRYHWFGLN